ncbi:MAG: response regulator [Alphaproteobacteria bacterium]|nr:response regulator [Alphaproteobacteria bacterium]
MRDPPLILIADDVPDNLEILEMRLESQGYAVATAVDGAEAVEKTRALQPDLLLLDIMMPKVDGIEALKAIKADPTLPFIPVILVTARADARDVIAGLESGADDYLTKPVDHAALSARVRAMLRIKSLHDTVQAQAQRLEQQAADLAALNRTLEQRVAAQVDEIERVGRLKRFLAPQVVDTIIASGGEAMLAHHRRDIVVLFCDMRGFTAFSETAEPEDVMTVLGEYHAVLGPLIHRYEGTLDRFTGDGLIVIFNDPVPCPDPADRAVRLAVEMRDAVVSLSRSWEARGHAIGFGVGIAQGYATLGQIGFEGRFHYTAMGTVINLAARLCADAESGQILVTRRIAAATDSVAEYEPMGDVTVKGLSRPVTVLNVRCLLS